jgi:AraC-like DNA-binding protein
MQPTPLPLIYISDSRTIYLGRQHLPLREVHSGTNWLLTCLEGSVRFRANNNEQWVNARCMLIPAGTKILIDNRDAVVSVCHLDAGEADFQAIKSMMLSMTNGVYFNYKFEDRLIEDLLDLREKELPFDEAMQRIEDIFYSPYENDKDELKADQRIHHVIQRLRSTAAENVSVKDLAKEVDMSESGLIKLFRKQVGAPIRKHRLWYRLMNFVILVMAGKSTAEAIPLAGFSDASHLSKSYSSLMGIPISIAFSQPPKIKCIVSDSALQAACKLPPETKPVDVYD